VIEPTPDNLRYLQTKAERMGHELPGLKGTLVNGTERLEEPV
jgi:hypothetical protein